MLRMISYGNNNDPIDNRGMNTLLNSAAVPNERCVSKAVAIENGTNETKMAEFEATNVGQSFSLNRLIPVWPIKESRVDTMCSTPYDSRNVKLEAVASEDAAVYPSDGTIIDAIPNDGDNHGLVAFTQDSYIAGYDYTFEIPSDVDWLYAVRDSKMINNVAQWGDGYYRDDGVFFYAYPLSQGQTSRATYVTVHAVKNQQIYDSLYPNGGGPNVCDTARLFVRQGDTTNGDVIAEYTGTNKLTLGFRGAQDTTNTHINTAAVYETSALSGAFYANNKLYGISEQDPDYNFYKKFVTANGNSVIIDIEYLKQCYPGSTGEETYYIYANWEGVGVTSNKIPVPKRNYSTSIDIIPNNDDSKLVSSWVPISFGNMNIYDTNDPDSTSTLRNKMCARCSCVAKVVYNWYYDKVTVHMSDFLYDIDHTGDITKHDPTTWENPGITPIFYPTTYQVDGQSGDFVWTSAGVDNASTQRTFNAISVSSGSIVTVNIYSVNKDWIPQDGSWTYTNKSFNVAIGNNSAASDYTIGTGSTVDVITTSTSVNISGTSFTIDLSDTTKYQIGSTHRFRLRQIIPDSDITVSSVESHNASPEYADIAFTIV